MSSLQPKHRWSLVIGGILLTFLLAAVFTFGSLDVPFDPGNWRAAIPLYAVSSFIIAALLVFGLIFGRTVLRLWAERSKDQLGARFKTKMVVGAMALSLLPVVFMFFVSYSLLNRTLGRWFPRPLEIASEQTQALMNDFGRTALPRLRNLARRAQMSGSQSTDELLKHSFESGLDALWILDKDGKLIRGGVVCDDQPEDRTEQVCERVGVSGTLARTLPSGVEIWDAQGKSYLIARIPTIDKGHTVGHVAAGYLTSPNFLARYSEIQARREEYDKEKQNLRALKRQMLLILVFLTVLLLFSLMWIALFLAKQVTVPIQALAEGTREVSSGNFDYQVPEQSQDELGILIRSFNAMTTQLRDSRAQIDQFTRNLQQAVQELERRRQLMETI
jgi:two-component system, NtrC family, nitrogen regulation sensor histidine kinase NtrY